MSDNEDIDTLEEEVEQVQISGSSKTQSKDKKSKNQAKKDKKNAGKKGGKTTSSSSNTKKASTTNLKDLLKPAEKKEADKKKDGYRMATGVLESQPRSKDVKIGGFSLTAWGLELIKDTTIELTIGHRYGLIGSNGSGKTTFLRSLANREVPIPDHIDIYFLEEEAEPSDLKPIEWVVREAEMEVKRLEALAEILIETEGADAEVVLDVYARLDEFEPQTFEARAARILVGLGFQQDMLNKMTKDMSGGWRMRVALARALFVKPTLLLLDEPTNHLDLEACVWLEDYLAAYDRCLVCVSHSQDFLNSVCSQITHITPKKTLVNYSGNYDQFMITKKENEVNQMKRWKKEQDDIKHIKQFIASCGTYANLVRQAKSKQKILDKMEEKGLTEKVVDDKNFNFTFAECEKLPPPVLTFVDVAFAYSGNMKDALYKGVHVGVDLDSRIALVGPNGAGKSTLLKLMVGELSPTEGQIRRHMHLVMGRYHQHSMAVLDPNLNVIEFMMKTYPEKKWEENEWRAQIGRYGVTGKVQKSKIGTLSDGYKSRIIFAMLAIDRPNLLLLDEPTNHLDMECIDALADAINTYQGGVVLVSHDFRLISQVAKEIWVCEDKQVSKWKGDIRSYKDSLLKKMKKANLTVL